MGTKSHGMSDTPIYYVWKNMRRRCTVINHPAYKYYGARGITVCQRWLDFNNFYADMGDKPEGKSLDRIDNDREYSKSNCRWATPMEQSQNSRRLRRVSFGGKEYGLAGFCREAQVCEGTIRTRLKRGWDIERAINQPVKKQSQARRNNIGGL